VDVVVAPPETVSDGMVSAKNYIERKKPNGNLQNIENRLEIYGTTVVLAGEVNENI